MKKIIYINSFFLMVLTSTTISNIKNENYNEQINKKIFTNDNEASDQEYADALIEKLQDLTIYCHSSELKMKVKDVTDAFYLRLPNKINIPNKSTQTFDKEKISFYFSPPSKGDEYIYNETASYRIIYSKTNSQNFGRFLVSYHPPSPKINKKSNFNEIIILVTSLIIFLTIIVLIYLIIKRKKKKLLKIKKANSFVNSEPELNTKQKKSKI